MISNPEYEKLDGLMEWLKSVPFEVLRHGRLYNAEELYRGYEPSDDENKDRASFANCYDSRVYQHFMSHGKIAKEGTSRWPVRSTTTLSTRRSWRFLPTTTPGGV